jgi:uroporphyrinogen-III synthase
MSLRNRVILITRQREQAGEMVREIERRGGIATVVPMISISPPPSWKSCDDAIERLADYDAVVFTSVNAVEGFLGRANILGVPSEKIGSLKVVVVGEKTAESVRDFGGRVEIVPAQFSGEGLADALGAGCSGKRLLMPRGSAAREETAEALAATGALVDSVVVYVTEKPEGLSAESFVRRVLTHEFDVVTFASPSAVGNFASLFGVQNLAAVPDHARIAVIGPSTADAVRSLGLPVDMVARQSTARGLVDCIEEYFST